MKLLYQIFDRFLLSFPVRDGHDDKETKGCAFQTETGTLFLTDDRQRLKRTTQSTAHFPVTY